MHIAPVGDAEKTLPVLFTNDSSDEMLLTSRIVNMN